MDRNIPRGQLPTPKPPSLSARRAWIEIKTRSQPSRPRAVALRKESVDRNFDTVQIVVVIVVALRKESVDRNVLLLLTYLLKYGVALRKESVDRNNTSQRVQQPWGGSLSARRAWIEIR